MPAFKLILCYDGTAYAGWQSQRNKPTVQDTLEAAIREVTGQSLRVLASGRTDAGVHALGQVVGFEVDTRLSAEVFHRALNANLPDDIAILELSEVPAGFHPTHHAVRKRYRYIIYDGPHRNVFQRQYCWQYPYGVLDADAMHAAAAALLGRHDFSSFESQGSRRKSSVRTISHISVCRRGTVGSDLPSADAVRAGEGRGESSESSGPWIVVEVEADGFLYNMVRAIVGTLAEVGGGIRPVTWPAEVMQAANRGAAGRTAPPQGLFLVNVDY
jgi:tRNA pseudouridine38-40 synthase